MRAGVLYGAWICGLAAEHRTSPFGSVVTGSLGLPSGLPSARRREGFPDMSRCFTVPGCTWKSGASLHLPDKEFRYLRTVIVTAAVYRGLASLPRHPEGWLTTPRNLPAPGRRQPLYVVLRLSRGLCFW